MEDIPAVVATQRIVERCASLVRARFWLEIAGILRNRRGGARRDGDIFVGGEGAQSVFYFWGQRDRVTDLKSVLSKTQTPPTTPIRDMRSLLGPSLLEVAC